MEKILAVGEDISLLRSRALLLAKTGAAAAFCTTSELPAYIDDAGVGLVVLCHTLKGEQRRRVLRQVEERWPRARVLQVFGRGSDQSLQSGVDGWVPSMEPGQLLELARKLLGRSTP